jgi:hypothetical protein
MTKLYWIILAISLPFSNGALAFDFGGASGAEFQVILAETKAIFEYPNASADSLVREIKALPQFGWQPRWMTELRTLDFLGYIYEIEKAQFYASAGRVHYPEHPMQQSVLTFYQTVLNPAHGPYTNGVGERTMKIFGDEFVRGLATRGEFRDIEVLKILLRSKREFWFSKILRQVFDNQEIKVSILHQLIEAMPSMHDWNRDGYEYLVRSVASRLDPSERADLIRNLYGVSAMNQDSSIYDVRGMKLQNPEMDCALLLEIDAEFAKIPGQRSRIYRPDF